MENNGRNSCTGNSRHISFRYFFVKDRIDKGEMSVLYCPTQNMLADFFTKPLQGSLFHRFRNVLMGFAHISTLQRTNDNVSSPELKERVEILNEISNENNQNKVVSSVDDDKNEKEKREKVKRKDTPILAVEGSFTDDVILRTEFCENSKCKEQPNHNVFEENVYE